MKKIFIFAFLIVSIFHLNAYAYEGHGFRVLSETIEHSPGVTGKFVPISGKVAPGMALAWSQAYDAEGRANTNVMLRGAHNISISNYTKSKQVYTYKYELNCDGQYFRKVDNVEVQPGGVVNSRGDSYLSTYHRTKGFFQVNASTSVSGESSHNHASTATLRVVQW